MTALSSPERIWWKPLGKTEKVWVTLAVLWALFLFVMMIVWGAAGAQDVPATFYRVSPAEFVAQTDAFVQKYQTGTLNGVPVVTPPPGGDAYLLARRFSWSPVLELRKGLTYRIHVSTADVQHGLSITIENSSLNFQVLPDYDYVITLTPQEAGEFNLICNEFCGLGHHLMKGKIVVKE